MGDGRNGIFLFFLQAAVAKQVAFRFNHAGQPKATSGLKLYKNKLQPKQIFSIFDVGLIFISSPAGYAYYIRFIHIL